MKRFLLAIIFFFAIAESSWAHHIIGGQIYYTLTSQSGNAYTYHVTLNLYKWCNSPPNVAQLDPIAPIGIFDRLTGATTRTLEIPLDRIVVLNLTSPSPCISAPPIV